MITNFINNNAVIDAVWLNKVDRAISEAIGPGNDAPTTPAEVRTNIGLGNVDNTSDLNKPISTDTQAALDLKSNITTTVTKDSSTGAAAMPTGTTAQRPVAPSYGNMRINSTTGEPEWWNGTWWGSIGSGQMYGTTQTKGIFYNSTTINEDVTVLANTNGLSAGPIEVGTGFTVTVKLVS